MVMRSIKVKSTRVIALSLLLGLSLVSLSLLLARPPVVNAATTWTVNSTGDAGDANLNDGICDSQPSIGVCTLRAAIQQAASGDTINFVAGLTTINLTNGELLINKSLTINGPGANLLTVQRSAAASTSFRVFDIASGN